MAADSPLTLFRRHGLTVVEQALLGLVNKKPILIQDPEMFTQLVIDPAWHLLPVALRSVGRAGLHWDTLFHTLRDSVFRIEAGKIVTVPDLRDRVDALAAQLLGDAPPAEEKPAKPANKPATPPPAKAGRTDLAIGIDLGTTYSLVAYLDSQGRPVCLPNTSGDLLTPSVVLFEDKGVIVGKEAVQAAALEPERVAETVKRDMGGKAYRKPILGKLVPPEVISSFILRSLAADAARKLGPVNQAVITVPAYFDEARRRATMDAGRLAGLDVLDILNEPTAAALAFGHQLALLDRSGNTRNEKPLRVLVFDLGGGTFDVTIVEIEAGSFKVLATDGDVMLGGKDWDEALIDLAAAEFIKANREDPRTNPVSRQELSLSAEQAKKTLTERQKAPVFVNHLGARLKVEVTREAFEAATEPLLGRTRATTEIVIRQAGLSWNDIDRVLLVGGSTRMPQISRMLRELTGMEPDRTLAPDEAVAHGAALYAGLLLQRRGAMAGTPGFAVTDVNSHSLGVVGTDRTTGRKKNVVLIPKNTPLPHTATKKFVTHKPGQKSVVVRVLEGESPWPEACSEVGACVVRDLPSDLPANWPVRVMYTYEANGRLRVAAQVEGQPSAAVVDFERETDMSPDDLQMWAEYAMQELLNQQ